MGSTLLAEIKTGADLVSSVWGAVGVVLVAGAVAYIIFKFFIGSGRNVMAGIGSLIGVAVLSALIAAPDKVIPLGQTRANLIGL